MSSLFGGFGGGTSADRSNQLGAWSNLNQLQGYGSSAGKNYVGQGAGFWSDILSGDPSKIATAIAPEDKIIRGQAQQQKNQIAQFGNRSGGTGGAAQMIDANAQGSIDNLINSLIPHAADTLTGLGTNLLGLSVNASGELGNQAERAREFDTQQNNLLGGGLFGMLSGGLGNITSGGWKGLEQFGTGLLGF